MIHGILSAWLLCSTSSVVLANESASHDSAGGGHEPKAHSEPSNESKGAQAEGHGADASKKPSAHSEAQKTGAEGHGESAQGAEGHADAAPEKRVILKKKRRSNSDFNSSLLSEKGKSNTCILDQSVLEDLERKKKEMEAKEKQLAAKEVELGLREKSIAEELAGLKKVRDEIQIGSQERAKKKESDVAKLVETFITMTPKSAAKVLATLDDRLAVAAISRMESKKLAKIMNLMDPARSSRLSELLAGLNGSKIKAEKPEEQEGDDGKAQ